MGHGDSIIVMLPELNGVKSCIIIDCYKARKTIDYLKEFKINSIPLMIATHPHADHILGFPKLIQEFNSKIDRFWDSGFRHTSLVWRNMINCILKNPNIEFSRPTSGHYTFINNVEILVLAPSISLRNRYDTYGVNVNNASIVLQLKYQNKSIILAGDAQWDSWGKISEEFPYYFKTQNKFQRIKTNSPFNPLKCNILKIAHHGSKHGCDIEMLERMNPKYSVISHGNRFNFPNEITKKIISDVVDNKYRTENGSVLIKITKRDIKVYKNQDSPNKGVNPNLYKKI